MTDHIESGAPRWRNALVGVGAVLGVGASVVGTTGPASAEESSAAAVCANQNPSDARNQYRVDLVMGIPPNLFDAGDVWLQYAPSTRCVRAITVNQIGRCASGGNGCAVAKVYLGDQLITKSTAAVGSIKAATLWVYDANVCQHAAGYLSYGRSSPHNRTACY